MELFDTTFLLSLHCLKLGMVQFYGGAKSWNGAIYRVFQVVEWCNNRKKYVYKNSPQNFLCLRVALFSYSHSIVEGGFEEMS